MAVSSIAIFGIDFTSAPSRRKPITCARCELSGTQLVVHDILLWTTFADFERWLHHPGPWVAALDFPFGQPLLLLDHLHWPTSSWSAYVAFISSLGKAQFSTMLDTYRTNQPVGKKLHLRATDVLAGAISPMMMHYIPVGKMFFEGAPRLLSSEVSIWPCRMNTDSRLVLEGYPSLVARRLIGRQSYKSETPSEQAAEQLAKRRFLVGLLQSQKLTELYGISLHLASQVIDLLVQDAKGDVLDALFCAIQAAWAYGVRDQGYGVPTGHELEGWIIDPTTCLIDPPPYLQ